MRLEVIRTVADWLISDVNVRIAGVPVDAGDPQPPLIPLFINSSYPNTTRAVFDETRHPWVLKREAPMITPALYVLSQGPIRMSGEPYPAGSIRKSMSPVQCVVRYIADNAADLAAAVRDGDYTLRAVARSLRQLSQNDQANQRLRNNILVVLGEDPMEFYPILEAVGQSRVAGALVLNYYIRDGSPEY